jgi:hypothetical protein
MLFLLFHMKIFMLYESYLLLTNIVKMKKERIEKKNANKLKAVGETVQQSEKNIKTEEKKNL